MPSLELKIAPPFLILITTIAMCALAYLGYTPLPLAPVWKVWGASLLAATAAVIFVVSKGLFIRLNTTWKPQDPGKASALITTGVYRYTRNPMYLAASFLLLALAVALGDLLAILLVPGFILYLTRFQIIPEERALDRLFGDDYREYRQRVRRWL